MGTTTRRGRRAARILAAVAAGVVAVGVTTTGTATAGATSSAGSARNETISHGNLIITDEIVGPSAGFNGDTVTFRTTVSAAEGTGEITSLFDIHHQGLNPSDLSFVSGTVTYTDSAGDRVTIPAVHGGADPEYNGLARATIAGPWQVNAATGATLVYESTFVYNDSRCFVYCDFGPGDPNDIRHALGVKATGLDIVWVRGLQVKCLLECLNFGS